MGLLSIVALPFDLLDFSEPWNTLEFMLSRDVILWRLCSSHRLSNLLHLRHSISVDRRGCWFYQKISISTMLVKGSLLILLFINLLNMLMYHMIRMRFIGAAKMMNAVVVKIGGTLTNHGVNEWPMYYGRVAISQTSFRLVHHNKIDQ